MGRFEYVSQRVGHFTIQEAVGEVGAVVYMQVDDDTLPVDSLESIHVVTAGRMQLTNEECGTKQEICIGEGSYELRRDRGRLRYEAVEQGTRFVCIAPASPGRRLHHQKIKLGFGKIGRCERANSVLVLCGGEVLVGDRHAVAPAVIWFKRGGVDVFARMDTVFVELWLEAIDA